MAGFQWTSIETGAVASGVPDAEFCYDGGLQGWIEFKATSGWAVSFRLGQPSWHRVRALRGGRSFIAIRRRNGGGPRRGTPVDELWLFAGVDAQRLKEEGLRGSAQALGKWSGGPAQWDWAEVQAALLRQM